MNKHFQKFFIKININLHHNLKFKTQILFKRSHNNYKVNQTFQIKMKIILRKVKL